MKTKFFSLLLVLLTATMVLSGCGKKGGPFPPEDSVYPRQYPES